MRGWGVDGEVGEDGKGAGGGGGEGEGAKRWAQIWGCLADRSTTTTILRQLWVQKLGSGGVCGRRRAGT